MTLSVGDSMAEPTLHKTTAVILLAEDNPLYGNQNLSEEHTITVAIKQTQTQNMSLSKGLYNGTFTGNAAQTLHKSRHSIHMPPSNKKFYSV